MHSFKKTKIVGTIGPASRNKEILTKLVHSGLNAARFNFSHGTHEDHKLGFSLVHEIEKEVNYPIAIIQDLQGPKIRLGDLQQESYFLEKGQNVTLFYGKTQENEEIPVQIDIFPFLKEGDFVLVNDGLIKLRVEKMDGKKATCMVTAGGEVRSHKGVNLPDTKIPNLGLTEKDKKDLAFGIQEEVDYIAVSFVQDENDITNVRKLLPQGEDTPKIITKIECKEAVKHLEEIVQASDAVMVARGDLAIEVGQEEVPIIQRKIISLARSYDKPVIVATQMLESMIHNSEPTRAEVNDVATAVLDKVDGVMLSAESAHGSYPVEAVSMMHRIIDRVEQFHEDNEKEYELVKVKDTKSQTTAIAAAASLLSYQLKARMLVALTATGRTAYKLASHRPTAPIIAVTDVEKVSKQLAICWGVQPLLVPTIKDNDKSSHQAIEMAKMHSWVKDEDRVVFVIGSKPGQTGQTNSIRVETV